MNRFNMHIRSVIGLIAQRGVVIGVYKQGAALHMQPSAACVCRRHIREQLR